MLSFEDLPVLQVLDGSENPLTISVSFPDRTVTAHIWSCAWDACRCTCSIPTWTENTPADRNLTLRLYYSDLDLRIAQEIMLGVGGARALRVLGYDPGVWHMNEGHAAFLTLERARELVAQGLTFEQAIAQTRIGNVSPRIRRSRPAMMSSHSGWWIKTFRITGPNWA